MRFARFLICFTITACAAEPATLDEPTDLPPDETDPGRADDGTELRGQGRILDVKHQVQETGYWCAPAASAMALSARMPAPTQQALANQLPTTTNGTDWIGQVTNTLNARLGAKWYVTREMPNDPPSAAQRITLWNDIVRSIDNGFPIVANIVAPASNHPPGYPSYTIYHYFTVFGYAPATRQVRIADSANFGGNKIYWLSFDQLATLIPPKGYTAPAPCTREAVVGAIAQKYDALGGCGSVIGPPITEERAAPDGVGRYSVFERGSIYWSPAAGAFEVHGRIRDRWAQAGWEHGPLGYPVSDEYAIPGGRRSDFQHGWIEWQASTDTMTVGP